MGDTRLLPDVAAPTEAELASLILTGPMFLTDTPPAPAQHVVGKVYFNLAENHRDPERLFAFMEGAR